MKVKEFKAIIGGIEMTLVPNDGDIKDQLMEIINFQPRYKCDECGSFDIADNRLFGNVTDDGITYIKVLCKTKDCKASSTLGTLKNNKGNYWRKYERYEGETTSPKRLEKKAQDDIEDYQL